MCSLRSRGVLAVLAMLGASGAIVAVPPEVLGRSCLRVAPGGSARSLALRSAHRHATRAGDGQTRLRRGLRARLALGVAIAWNAAAC